MVRMHIATVVACLAGIHGSSASTARSVSGVQKVIQMLTAISENAKKEKADEEVAFAKFETWCSQESANLKTDIAKGEQQIELLSTSVGKLSSDAKTLGEEVAKLNEDLTRFQAEQAAQTEQRNKDHADFLAQEKDFSESVDALERAMRVLEQKSQDVPGAKAALLQLADSGRLPQKAQSLVAAFMGMSDEDGQPDFASYSAPVADAYEFQSGGIIELLKRLRDEFRGKLATTQKEEQNSKHAFDMIMQDLAASVSNAGKQAAVKSSEKLSKEEKAAQDQKQLQATQAAKAENDQTLSDLQAECQQKSLSFQEKQNLRAEELEAIDQALKILASPDVTGNAEKHLALAQSAESKGAALVQLGSLRGRSEAETEGVRRQLRDFLEAAGRRLHSPQLTLLAQRAEEDPFAKVKGLISDMLTRLYHEANEDAKHEGFCDAELGKSQITRAKLTENIDLLTAAVEGGKSTILGLTDTIAQLSAQVSELQRALAEATELRAQEKAKNAATVKDAKAAQAAVEQAMQVLRDFYAKALTATALLQVRAAPAFGLKGPIKMGSPEWQALANPNYSGSRDTGHKEGMQTFGETYQGRQAESSGVLALMEVIASDFANLRTDTEGAETASQRAFQEFTRESKKNLAVKQRNIQMNEADKASAEVKLQEDTKDLKGTEDELLAAERYHANLVPQCVDQGVSFDDRQKARADEVASLKQALQILGGELA